LVIPRATEFNPWKIEKDGVIVDQGQPDANVSDEYISNTYCRKEKALHGSIKEEAMDNFCPYIKGKCRTDCVKWNEEQGKCIDLITSEAYQRAATMSESYEYFARYMQLSWQLEVKRLLNDPTVPPDIKEAIQQAQDITTLEKLLRDAGLI